MSEASFSLGLLGSLFDHDATHLAEVLNRRGIPVINDPTPVGLAQYLSKKSAINLQLGQLTRSELARLAELPHPTSPEDQGMLDGLLAISDSLVTQCRPEIRQALVELQVKEVLAKAPERDAPATAAMATGDLDVPGVFGALESFERVLEFIRRERWSAANPPRDNDLAQAQRATELDPEILELARDLGMRVGFFRHLGDHYVVTPEALRWQRLGSVSKWSTLVVRWKLQLPVWWPGTMSRCDTSAILELARVNYPLADPLDAARLVELSGWLGLQRAGTPTVLAPMDDSDDITEAIGQAVPAEVNQVYPDGPDTLVAPGPLSTEAERVLRECADWISGGLAPRFRISPASITRALQSGWSGRDIAERLGNLLSKGMGHAITEMVQSTVNKALALSVYPDPSGCTLTSTDDLTLRLVQADRRLSEAGLRPTDTGHLHSNLVASRLHDLLLAEGYPHLLRQKDGSLGHIDASATLATSSGNAVVWDRSLVDSLRRRFLAARDEPGFFDEAVELAISHKVPLVVTVDMGGEHTRLRIEPHALKNGRLRGLDTRSEVERTIPMSHLVALTVGESESFAP